jgi:hypothetical protein
MALQTTFTPPLKLAYSGASCLTVSPLNYWAGQSPTALDMMAFAAALKAGYNRANFNFNVVFVPRCTGTGFSGIGWIGAPGALIYTYAVGFEEVTRVCITLSPVHKHLAPIHITPASRWRTSSDTTSGRIMHL